MASPVLLHNLCQSDRPPSSMTVWLHGIGRPSIPTASSVTLAIIASPFSCEEPYRSILVETLKSNLESAKRLVKKGDIISVGIDTSVLRSSDVSLVEEEVGQSTWVIGFNASPTASHPILSDSIPPRTNLVGFFAVSDLHIDPTSASLTSSDGHILGELGCWLNSFVTRVIQAGVTRSCIPDVTTYVGAGEIHTRF